MNKINKYLLTGIVSLSMTACANLDLNPLSEGSSENWYHDETEIEMHLMICGDQTSSRLTPSIGMMIC